MLMQTGQKLKSQFSRGYCGGIELERSDDPELVAGMAGHEVPGVFWNTWRLLNDRQEGVDLGESFEGYEATYLQ